MSRDGKLVSVVLDSTGECAVGDAVVLQYANASQ
jgi:hypothetical protein